MSSIKDLIAKKQKEIQAKKGRVKPIKFGVGKTRIRILPSWRGQNDPNFFHDFGMHFVRESDKGDLAVYICTDATFGKECPVCQAIGQGIKNSNDDEQIKLLKRANAGQRYLMNVLVVNDDPAKSEPAVMDAGIGLFEDICSIIAEYDDITLLKGGTDLIVTREGTGQFDTKYSVFPTPKSKDVPESIYAKVHNLDDYVAQENDSDKMKAVTAVSRAAGFLGADDATHTGPALSAPKTAADDLSSVMDDTSAIEDATIVESSTPEPETVKPTAADLEVDLDDDDLDDLLADLG